MRFQAHEPEPSGIKAPLVLTNKKTCQFGDKMSFQPVTDMVILIGYVVTGTDCLYISHN